MIHACLNGDRPPGAHPPIPVTPDELARAAAGCVAAGAFMVHVHPRDEHGRETLAVRHVVEAVTAIRPLGVATTSPGRSVASSSGLGGTRPKAVRPLQVQPSTSFLRKRNAVGRSA